jgi:hypothetical protein
MSSAKRNSGKMTLRFIVDVFSFVRKNRNLIRDFLNHDSNYRVFKVSFTKNSYDESSAEIAFYRDGKSHYYLSELDTKEIRRAINYLDPDMTLSSGEEVE